MACATLKRNLDWDMAQQPAKRRRCAPLTASPSTSPGQIKTENKSSVFGEVCASAKITPERVVQDLCDEIKRIQNRKQLHLASGSPISSSSGSEGDSSPPHRSMHSNRTNNKVLFTFKQVRMICERMLRDQEEALRTEYEAALSTKLAEQYEAFVRFNLDQVQRRPAPYDVNMHQDLVPSYLS